MLILVTARVRNKECWVCLLELLMQCNLRPSTGILLLFQLKIEVNCTWGSLQEKMCERYLISLCNLYIVALGSTTKCKPEEIPEEHSQTPNTRPSPDQASGFVHLQLLSICLPHGRLSEFYQLVKLSEVTRYPPHSLAGKT